jgi:hypothetical protein
LGIGVQQGGEPSERSSSIPVPGSTVGTDDLYPGQLRVDQPPSYATIGSADLISQPGILAQLFPNLLDSILGGNRGLRGNEQESRQVVEAFGIEAPTILNNYALQLETMLDSAVAWGNRASDTIQNYAEFAVNEHQENLAYNEILTNPDVLSDYTLKFFGPEGPYPVYESEAQLETPGYRTQQIQQPELGMMPAPPAAAAPQQPGNFWGDFNEQMARDPQNAWRVLNQAQPQVVANKLFVME